MKLHLAVPSGRIFNIEQGQNLRKIVVQNSPERVVHHLDLIKKLEEMSKMAGMIRMPSLEEVETGNIGLRKRRVVQDQRLQTRLVVADMKGEAKDTPRCRRYSSYPLNMKEQRYAKEDRNCPLEQLP